MTDQRGSSLLDDRFAAALVMLCDTLESRCWTYFDAERREWVSFDFVPLLAAIGWLPEGQHPERNRVESLGPLRKATS